MDFLIVEVATMGRLVTYYVLIALERPTHRVQVGGLTPEPDTAFMMQVCRNLTCIPWRFLESKRFVIMDRDGKYCKGFRSLLKESGTKVRRLSPRSPNLNAYAERFVLSLEQECLNRTIFFSEISLRRTLSSYVSHHHRERSHQGLENLLIEPEETVREKGGQVCCRERLGGLLKYDYRERDAA